LVCSSTFVAELWEDVKIIIPDIEKHLKDSDLFDRKFTIELLSKLAEQGMCLRHVLAGVLKHVGSWALERHSGDHSSYRGTS